MNPLGLPFDEETIADRYYFRRQAHARVMARRNLCLCLPDGAWCLMNQTCSICGLVFPRKKRHFDRDTGHTIITWKCIGLHKKEGCQHPDENPTAVVSPGSDEKLTVESKTEKKEEKIGGGNTDRSEAFTPLILSPPPTPDLTFEAELHLQPPDDAISTPSSSDESSPHNILLDGERTNVPKKYEPTSRVKRKTDTLLPRGSKRSRAM